ncbi:hypothetical protein ACFRI7_22275 [Streptomyces sp. NPDC056716]|uniref:hypothetical protein n=1 Tax=unclassified Streptomyces TaxID=2593676 RepID=UPI00368389CB
MPSLLVPNRIDSAGSPVRLNGTVAVLLHGGGDLRVDRAESGVDQPSDADGPGWRHAQAGVEFVRNGPVQTLTYPSVTVLHAPQPVGDQPNR